MWLDVKYEQHEHFYCCIKNDSTIFLTQQQKQILRCRSVKHFQLEKLKTTLKKTMFIKKYKTK